MKFVVCVALAVAMLGACELSPKAKARADAAAAKQAAATKVASADPNEKKICKTITAIGSNMPQRVCSTQAEWDAYKTAGQQGVEADKQARDGLGGATDAERPR